MMPINFSEKDKTMIREAGGYIYYEFTEESVKTIAAKEVRSVEDHEWRSLLQMIYPDKLICSGLFEPFLVFEIHNGCRKDPPKEHWGNLIKPGSDGILLERFISALSEHGIEAHKSWRKLLNTVKQRVVPIGRG